MTDLVDNFIGKAQSNNYFRQVLATGDKTQSVVMSLQPGEDIGSEVHPDNEQVLICLDGSGKAVLNGEEMPFNKGDLVVVIAGTEHNFINTGASSMKVITIYSPPDHPAGTINKTKADAQAEES